MAGLKNVMIVEDDPMIRDLYKYILIDGGYIVETASGADELYSKLKVFQPECVLLDIMLPGISGIDILKDLRTDPAYKCENAKIVLLTNLADSKVTETAINNGADGYVIKADIMPKDLLDIIKSVED